LRPMQTKLSGRTTQEPMRGWPSIFGSDFASRPASFLRPAGEMASPSMSRTAPDRSRRLPSAASIAGFSAPGAPTRSNFMGRMFSGSNGEATVDDDGLAGHELGIVAREIDRELGDFLWGAEPAHLLARDEGGARGFDGARRRRVRL